MWGGIQFLGLENINDNNNNNVSFLVYMSEHRQTRTFGTTIQFRDYKKGEWGSIGVDTI